MRTHALLTAKREDLLDLALVRQVARRLLKHEVVQRERLTHCPHESELIQHARTLVLVSFESVRSDGLPALHLASHLVVTSSSPSLAGP